MSNLTPDTTLNADLGHEFPFPNATFWTRGRSELTLPDVFGNDADILTAVFKSSNSGTHYHVGDKTRIAEHFFDGNDYTIYLKFLPNATNGRLFGFGGATANVRRGIEIRKYSDTRVDINMCDDVVSVILTPHPALTLSGWTEILIHIDGTAQEVVSRVYHSGGTSEKTTDISSFAFNNNDNYEAWCTLYCDQALCNVKKFANIITIDNCRLDSYVTDLQIWLPDMLSGTDVSGNKNHIRPIRIYKDDVYYASEITYLLDNGYSIYKSAGLDDMYIPHDINGNAINDWVLLNYTDRYVFHKEVAGSANYFNLADAMVEFTGIDRSDTTMFSDEARLNFYDASNPTRWHSSEINKLIINDYLNSGYKGMVFPKCSSNSYESRNYLKEFIILDVERTGADLYKALRYTGDSQTAEMIYLKTPYTQVPIITANSDSEFTIQINDSIYYSYANIKTKTDLMQKINEDEDFMSKLFRWLMSNTAFVNTNQLLSLYQDAFIISNANAKYLRLPFSFLNSYPYGRCLELAQFAYAAVKNYSITDNTVYRLGSVGHAVADNIDAYIDLLYGVFLYSGKYENVNVAEIVADKYLWTEPMRVYEGLYRQRGGTDWTEAHWSNIAGGTTPLELRDTPAIDNMTMKLPTTATLTLPVKTANIPQTDQDVNIDAYNQGIVTAGTGVTGDVDMPFYLLQITGTGEVVVDGITYTLPTDEAALKVVLQGYAKFYHDFEITVNSGGIEAEYLVSPRLLQLYHNNTYLVNTISGSVSVSKVTTSDIVPTYILTVDTANEETLWSITQDKLMKPDSILVSKTGEGGAERRFIYYYKDGLRPETDEVLSSVSLPQIITAGTPVYDTCFAPVMTPKSDGAAGSFEVTLTSVDGANIYYTDDGTTPDATDTLYVNSFTIVATKTIKAICIKTDYEDSNVISREITIT